MKNSCLPKLICELNAMPQKDKLTDSEKALLSLIRSVPSRSVHQNLDISAWRCCPRDRDTWNLSSHHYMGLSGGIGVRISEEGGRDDCSVCKLWLSERRLSVDFRVEKSVNPSTFPLPSTICAKSAIPEGNLGPRVWPAYYPTKVDI